MEFKGLFFLLRLSSWQKLHVGASAGMLQRFCRARDDRPPHNQPISFLLLISFLWSDVIALESDCHWQGDCVLWMPNCAAESKVRGQQPAQCLNEPAQKIHGFYARTIWNTHFLRCINVPHQPPSLPFVSSRSQHALNSLLCWVSYSPSEPSAPCTPCCQMTPQYNSLKFSSLSLIQANKSPADTNVHQKLDNVVREDLLCTCLTFSYRHQHISAL